MKKRLFNVVVTLCIIVLLLLGFKELTMFYNAQLMAESLKEVAVQVPRGEDDNHPFNRHIDFDSLKSINPDIVGWLYVPGTVIDYPILIGDDDLTYQNRDYTGSSSVIGSIFSFADADLLNDDHILLFGHNMISGQMFGNLKKYKSYDYASQHMYAYIYTPDRTKECQLISTFNCHKTDEVFELDGRSREKSKEKKEFNESSIFGSSNSIGNTKETEEFTGRTLDEWNSFVNKRSIYPLGIPDTAGQLYTLSTCDGYSGTSNRLAVNYTVIREKYVLE